MFPEKVRVRTVVVVPAAQRTVGAFVKRLPVNGLHMTIGKRDVVVTPMARLRG